MSCRVSVHVPASTSNLGAGFDCIGVAVDRWLEVNAALADSERGFTITRRGTLAALSIAAEDDRLVAGFRAACRGAGREVPRGVVIDATSTIPVGRGLGSSASATLAGALAADALLELGLGTRAIALLCAGVEGHPDNVVPSLFGGARLALEGSDGALLVTPLAVHESLALVFAIPDFAVETTHARAVLPASVPHATATRAAALGAALVPSTGAAPGTTSTPVTVAGAAPSAGRAMTIPPRFARRTAAPPAAPPAVDVLRPGLLYTSPSPRDGLRSRMASAG